MEIWPWDGEIAGWRIIISFVVRTLRWVTVVNDLVDHKCGQNTETRGKANSVEQRR